MTEPGSSNLQRAAATLVLALSALVLGGCSGSAARNLPAARLSAIGHNQRGVEEEVRGNDAAALAEFSEALRLHGSIENVDGMVVALINMARTQRLKGDIPSARSSIERACSLRHDSSELAPELFFEKAKILLAAGELTAAKDWAVTALAREQGGDQGRRANLVATILNRMGLPDQARQQAEQALKLNQNEKLAGEEANSLRLLGEIHLAQGKHEQAMNAFQGALLLDKELGFGRKIASDLRGLGSAALKREDLPGAIGYYRRAMEVSLNGADAGLAADDMARLAELYRRNGEPLLAEKLADDRK
jgi:tetratricopeptide (TPR) repeat protein